MEARSECNLQGSFRSLNIRISTSLENSMSKLSGGQDIHENKKILTL